MSTCSYLYDILYEVIKNILQEIKTVRKTHTGTTKQKKNIYIYINLHAKTHHAVTQDKKTVKQHDVFVCHNPPTSNHYGVHC
jgi:hypothetical protein